MKQDSGKGGFDKKVYAETGHRGFLSVQKCRKEPHWNSFCGRERLVRGDAVMERGYFVRLECIEREPKTMRKSARAL